MSVASQTEQSPRARPVADAPVEALIARADELTRRWVSELILTRPLARMAEIPLGELAREGPGLCDQLLRALGSDEELHRLISGGRPWGRRDAQVSAPERLLRALDSAREPRAAVEAVEALRGVLWQQMLSELRDPPVRLVSDLADRLACVSAALLAATLGQSAEVAREAPVGMAPSVGREQVLYSAAPSAPGGRGAVLIDEREGAERWGATAGRPRGARAAAPGAERSRAEAEVTGQRVERRAPMPSAAPRPRPLPWDTPLDIERPGAGAPRASDEEDRTSMATPNGPEPAVRITRGPSSAVD